MLISTKQKKTKKLKSYTDKQENNLGRNNAIRYIVVERNSQLSSRFVIIELSTIITLNIFLKYSIQIILSFTLLVCRLGPACRSFALLSFRTGTYRHRMRMPDHGYLQHRRSKKTKHADDYHNPMPQHVCARLSVTTISLYGTAVKKIIKQTALDNLYLSK